MWTSRRGHNSEETQGKCIDVTFNHSGYWNNRELKDVCVVLATPGLLQASLNSNSQPRSTTLAGTGHIKPLLKTLQGLDDSNTEALD